MGSVGRLRSSSDPSFGKKRSVLQRRADPIELENNSRNLPTQSGPELKLTWCLKGNPLQTSVQLRPSCRGFIIIKEISDINLKPHVNIGTEEGILSPAASKVSRIRLLGFSTLSRLPNAVRPTMLLSKRANRANILPPIRLSMMP